jgi:hypothetical protein
MFGSTHYDVSSDTPNLTTVTMETKAVLMNNNHLLKVQKILLIQLIQDQTGVKDYQMISILTSVHTGNFSLLLLYLNCTIIQRI